MNPKGCISSVLVFILVPIMFFMVMLTSVTMIINNKSSYQSIWQSNKVQESSTKYFVAYLQQVLIENIPNSSTLFSSQRSEAIITKFVEKLKTNDLLNDYLRSYMEYINGNSPTLDVYLNSTVSEVDINSFKQDLVQYITEVMSELKRCNTDKEYNELLAKNQLPDCRPSSLTVADIIKFSRSLVDDSINYSQVKDALSGKVVLEQETLKGIQGAREQYAKIKNLVLVGWGVVGILIFLILMVNVFGRFSFGIYIAVPLFIVSILTLFISIILQYVAYPAIKINPDELVNAGSGSFKEKEMMADLTTNLVKEIVSVIYQNLYFWSGALFGLFIIFFTIHILLNRKSTTLVEKKQYVYVPQPVTPVVPQTQYTQPVSQTNTAVETPVVIVPNPSQSSVTTTYTVPQQSSPVTATQAQVVSEVEVPTTVAPTNTEVKTENTVTAQSDNEKQSNSTSRVI